MLLKVYLITIVVFWIADLIINKLIKIQLKKDGLLEKMKEIDKASSLIDRTKVMSGRIIVSIIPIFNLLMAAYMFVEIDTIYIKVKEKCLPEDSATCLSRNISEAFERVTKAAEESTKEKHL
jgi:hypothetical protein